MQQMLEPTIRFVKIIGRFAERNAPALLTAAGVVGVMNTAVLASVGSYKAALVIRDHEYEDAVDMFEDPVELELLEKVRLVWPLYLPAALSAASTIVCVVGVNAIHNRRSAALLSLYSLTETAFQEYKDKVAETVGPNKALAIKDGIAQDRVSADPVTSREVIITGRGDVLCYETMTGRYFQSDMETLRRVENDLNSHIIRDSYVSLNDFCSLVGLPTLPHGEELGWNSNRLIELQFSGTLSEDGRPCIAVDYNVVPKRHYYKAL